MVAFLCFFKLKSYMDMASVAIELKNINVEFSRERILDQISLSIPQSECFVIVGPSGQGKSVLLKTMAGLIEPTKGEVLIQGQNWKSLKGSKRQELLQKIGMLFQKNALFDSLTVAENIAFPLRENTNSSEKEIHEIIDYFLDAVGISHAKNLYPDEISGGMQKRLGIARALALKPEIIFYDDPTAGLDPITSRKIIELIKELQHKNKTTVVAITNDMNRAFQLANRMAMVVDKSVIITGTPEQTKAHSDPRVHQFIRGELNGPLMGAQ